MPNYDYKCKSCSTNFSDVKTVAKRYEAKCPECDQQDAEIVINVAPGFNYDNRMGAYRTTDSFNDRLKEMKKNVAKDNTLNDVIR